MIRSGMSPYFTIPPRPWFLIRKLQQNQHADFWVSSMLYWTRVSGVGSGNLHLKKKLMYLSIYFGRARPSLVCRFFPGYGEHGLLSGCSARASNCSGFLLQSIESRVCRHQYLWCVGSVVVAPWFWREGSVVVVHRFICFTSCGIFPDQG